MNCMSAVEVLSYFYCFTIVSRKLRSTKQMFADKTDFEYELSRRCQLTFLALKTESPKIFYH